MAEQKSFYVGISNKSDLRKGLLECSKEIVGILKDYERLNSIREEKIEKIVELNNIVTEIKQLNNALKSKLPNDSIKSKPLPVKKSFAKKAVKEKMVKKQAPVKIIAKKPTAEIKKLEEELSEIEERLNKINV